MVPGRNAISMKLVSIQLEHRLILRVLSPAEAEKRMKRPGTFGGGVMAMALVAFALSLTLRCTAEPADDADFAGLQVDARKSFKNVVTPFVDTYCTRCHGQNRQRGGINFGPALMLRVTDPRSASPIHQPPRDARQFEYAESVHLTSWLGRILIFP